MENFLNEHEQIPFTLVVLFLVWIYSVTLRSGDKDVSAIKTLRYLALAILITLETWRIFI